MPTQPYFSQPMTVAAMNRIAADMLAAYAAREAKFRVEMAQRQA